MRLRRTLSCYSCALAGVRAGAAAGGWRVDLGRYQPEQGGGPQGQVGFTAVPTGFLLEGRVFLGPAAAQ